jgi:hypothetical protein
MHHALRLAALALLPCLLVHCAAAPAPVPASNDLSGALVGTPAADVLTLLSHARASTFVAARAAGKP